MPVAFLLNANWMLGKANTYNCQSFAQISYPDLSNYDPELAWPLILDNFVEWVREKQS